MIYPAQVKFYRDGGLGNMGDHADSLSTVARIHVPGHRIVPVFVRAHFERMTGTGTEIADMSMVVDSGNGASYDNVLHTWENVGVGYDVVLRIPQVELIHYVTDVDDDVVFEWTNPDADDIRWGLEAGYIYADEVSV